MNIMNTSSGYVGLGNDNPQQNTLVPTELMHLGEHFDDVPCNVLRVQRWQSGVRELPQTNLFNMLFDGHWQRPTRKMRG